MYLLFWCFPEPREQSIFCGLCVWQDSGALAGQHIRPHVHPLEHPGEALAIAMRWVHTCVYIRYTHLRTGHPGRKRDEARARSLELGPRWIQDQGVSEGTSQDGVRSSGRFPRKRKKQLQNPKRCRRTNPSFEQWLGCTERKRAGNGNDPGCWE